MGLIHDHLVGRICRGCWCAANTKLFSRCQSINSWKPSVHKTMLQKDFKFFLIKYKLCHFSTRGLQHAMLPCPSLSPGVYSDSCPSTQWCHPTISCGHPFLLPSIFPNIKVFSNELVFHIRWPKYWRFTFSINPSSEYSGLTWGHIKILKGKNEWDYIQLYMSTPQIWK